MNNPKTAIMVILGRGCNMHCKYCIQRDIKKNQCDDINDKNIDKVIDFLDKNGSEGDLLSFYGGEPLLYFDDIVKICQSPKTHKYEKIMATNGKLLTSEKVFQLNELGIEVIVSWDGDASTHARGFDVLTKKKDVLLQVKKLKFHGVLSSKVSIYEAF